MEQQNKQHEWIQVAEIELVYKTKMKASERPEVRCSADIYQLLLSTWNKNLIDLQEEFKVLLMNRNNKVLGLYHSSTGGLTLTVADPRLILVAAIKSGACSIVLAHNHPSGSLRPSKGDEVMTAKMKEACSFLDIHLLDHIIVTSESYLSFADEGLL